MSWCRATGIVGWGNRMPQGGTLEQGATSLPSTGRGSAYKSSTRVNVKVLDFVKRGGPKWTVDRTVFEMWLGSL